MRPDVHQLPLDLPTLVERYERRRPIGAGGMAEVFEGYDRMLGRPVAIKVLRPQYSIDPDFVARFLREASATAGLNHPNVAAVFDAGSDQDTHFIVMEYVRGRTLRELLEERGRLPIDGVAAVIAAAATGIAAAHAHGLVHRDIKPGNIMVTPDAIKVVDFGIARAADSAPLTRTTSVLGTPLYLSPEQAQGYPLDARSDIYALGVCLYELLTGVPPFLGESAFAIAYKHVHAAPRPPRELRDEVPVALDAVVLRAMAKDPADRYQTATEMRAAIEWAVVGATAPTRRVEPRRRSTAPLLPAPGPPDPGPEERPAGRPRTRRAVLALAAVALGGVAVAAAPAFLGDDPAIPTGQAAGAFPGPTNGAATMPYLRGLTVAAATAELRRVGILAAPAIRRRVDAAVPAGLVLGTDPGVGTRLAPGMRVTLLVSDGAPPGTAIPVTTAGQPETAATTTTGTTTTVPGAAATTTTTAAGQDDDKQDRKRRRRRGRGRWDWDD
jgi:hypothetical protein